MSTVVEKIQREVSRDFINSCLEQIQCMGNKVKQHATYSSDNGYYSESVVIQVSDNLSFEIKKVVT